MAELDFNYCTTNMCLYAKNTKKDLTIVGVCVDGITGSSSEAVKQSFQDMVSLEIKDIKRRQQISGLRVMLDVKCGYLPD